MTWFEVPVRAFVRAETAEEAREWVMDHFPGDETLNGCPALFEGHPAAEMDAGGLARLERLRQVLRRIEVREVNNPAGPPEEI